MKTVVIADCQPPETLEILRQAGIGPPGERFEAILSEFAPNLRLVHLAPGERTVDPRQVADGVVWSGSSHSLRGELPPAVQSQLQWCRHFFERGIPQFGSCWGLQLANVACSGRVEACRKGREFGLCGPIRALAEHPMFAGKDDGFRTPTYHQDEITQLASGAVRLAENDHCRVQAAEFRRGSGVFWGVQYHPECDLDTFLKLLRSQRTRLVEEGRFQREEQVDQFADRVASKEKWWRSPHRYLELRNWLRHFELS